MTQEESKTLDNSWFFDSEPFVDEFPLFLRVASCGQTFVTRMCIPPPGLKNSPPPTDVFIHFNQN